MTFFRLCVVVYTIISSFCLSAGDQSRRDFLKSLYKFGVGAGLCGVASNSYLRLKGGTDVVTEFYGRDLKNISSSEMDPSYRYSFVNISSSGTNCNGQLILNNSTVLTAAHCFASHLNEARFEVNIEGIGWTRKSQEVRFLRQYAAVSRAWTQAFEKTAMTFDSYSKIVQTNLRYWKLPDVALIKLNRPAPKFSKPICLDSNSTADTIKRTGLEYIAKSFEEEKVKWTPLKGSPSLGYLQGTDLSAIEVRTACQSCQGLSGGGLFFLESGKPLLISVDSAALDSFYSVSQKKYCTAPLKKSSRVALSHLDSHKDWIRRTAGSFIGVGDSDKVTEDRMLYPLTYRNPALLSEFGKTIVSCFDQTRSLRVELDKEWNVKVGATNEKLPYVLTHSQISQVNESSVSIAFPGQAFDLVVLDTSKNKVAMQWLGLSQGKTKFQLLECVGQI